MGRVGSDLRMLGGLGRAGPGALTLDSRVESLAQILRQFDNELFGVNITTILFCNCLIL